MKKVLFIDDNHELRQITLEALELEGFNVMGAEDGRQGIEIAKKQLPDIILCDIMMPETDGFEVYSELRQYAPTSLTPFIFLTALAEKENLRKGMEIGADDYVTKPFTLAELLTTIYSRLIKSEVIETRIEVRQKELRERIINHLPHELLTPLNGILGFATLIKDDYKNFTSAEIREMAGEIETSGTRLHDLIKNFINYIRIASADDSEFKPVRLDNIQLILAELSKNIAKKHFRKSDLILQLEPAEINMEKDDFEYIINELVDNAFKFSERESNVIVTNSVSNNSVEIRITDHGIGFPIENIQDIGAFNQFNRKKIEQQGAGLGLITSMLTVQRYHGSLSITNDKFGASIILKIPAQIPDLKQDFSNINKSNYK